MAAPKLHETATEVRTETGNPRILDLVSLIAEIILLIIENLPRGKDQVSLNEAVLFLQCVSNVVEQKSDVYGFGKDWAPVKQTLDTELSGSEKCSDGEYVCLENNFEFGNIITLFIS